MNYYLVLCKCGHVQRNFYMPIWFPVEANDGREAAAIARDIPRVKHDHKDAILDCIETDYEGFLAQIEINRQDPYLLCHSKHEQELIFPLIKDRLVPDPHWKGGDVEKFRNRKPNLLFQNKKYNLKFEFDF